mmetsp:Transcript_11981/g.23355  ORF Transcript_11981/g.23355 Transcript_11981/m.23355 type:complete len:143 (-) Transcript_11981:708-1136(-)
MVFAPSVCNAQNNHGDFLSTFHQNVLLKALRPLSSISNPSSSTVANSLPLKLKFSLTEVSNGSHLTTTPCRTLQFDQGTILPDGFHPSKRIPAFHQFLDELIDLESGNIGHDNDVGNVFFASELPSFDEFVVHRSLEDDGGG